MFVQIIIPDKLITLSNKLTIQVYLTYLNRHICFKDFLKGFFSYFRANESR
jgi:hypothetical protein